SKQRTWTRNNIYISELAMTMGQAWGSLKKSWKLFKLALRERDHERVEELKNRISHIRAAMDVENEEIW
ncbi:MAG: hypothetical protein WA323_27155, partial [Candidatus Nitrosopolaris sp.]